jgi:hypothetical protein
MALGTVLLVSCVTGVTVMELTHREWERLLESKRTAADMVAHLFAGTVAATLDFGEIEAVQTGLGGLRSNSMIVYAAVFSADNQNPVAEYHNGRGDGSPADAHGEGEIQVQSAVHSPTGAHLGSVVIRVSLAQEVHAFRRTRARLVGFGALFAAALASLLVVIFQHLHTIRAEARCFDLPRLEREVEGVENELGRIRRDGYQQRGTDHDELGRGLTRVGRRLDEAERSFLEQSPLGASALDQISVRRSRLPAVADATASRSDRVARLVEELAARPLVESFALLPEAVARWPERAGKKVQLAFDLEGQEISFALSRVLGGVLSHLLRNAVAHGIESESERLERGKPALGTVRVSAEAGPLGTIIRIDDDGRGFDLDTLAAGGGTGATAEHAFAAALTPGVSTTHATDELSGAGVGLAAVQSELCGVGYQVELISTSARGCSIEIAPMPRRDSIQERHVG